MENPEKIIQYLKENGQVVRVGTHPNITYQLPQAKPAVK